MRIDAPAPSSDASEVKLPNHRIQDIRFLPEYQKKLAEKAARFEKADIRLRPEDQSRAAQSLKRSGWPPHPASRSSQGYRPTGQSYLSDRESRNRDCRSQRPTAQGRHGIPYQYPPEDQPTPPPRKSQEFSGIPGGYNTGNKTGPAKSK